MKSFFIIFIFSFSTLFSSCFASTLFQSSSEGENFLLKSSLIGNFKKNVKKSSRNSKGKNIIEIVEVDGENFAQITLSYKDKGHESDWNRVGERNQRWEIEEKKKSFDIGKTYYLFYKFRIPKSDLRQGATKFFQIIGTHKNGGSLNPVAQLRAERSNLYFSFFINHETLKTCGDDNSWMKYNATRFNIGNINSLFNKTHFLAIKFNPSKDKDGLFSMMFNNEKIINIKGRNFSVGHGIKHKLGLYRGELKKTDKNQSIQISKFGTSKNCSQIMDKKLCDKLNKIENSNYSKLQYRNYSYEQDTHGKKICENEIGPKFTLNFDE